MKTVFILPINMVSVKMICKTPNFFGMAYCVHQYEAAVFTCSLPHLQLILEKLAALLYFLYDVYVWVCMCVSKVFCLRFAWI